MTIAQRHLDGRGRRDRVRDRTRHHLHGKERRRRFRLHRRAKTWITTPCEHQVRVDVTRYDYGKGPVVLHTSATLARELKAEAVLTRELDERVAEAVTKLAPVSG